MTLVEFHETLSGIQGNIIDLTGQYISVFVAYLVCAYFVGKKLSKFQVFAITTTYSIFQLLMIFIALGNVNRALSIIRTYNDIEPPDFSVYLIGPGMMLVAWVISIVFMFQSRREPGN